MKKVENMKKLMTLILLAVPLASTVRAQWIVYDPTVHMQQILDEAQDIAKHVQMIENQVQQISERRRANVQKERKRRSVCARTDGVLENASSRRTPCRYHEKDYCGSGLPQPFLPPPAGRRRWRHTDP